MNVNMKHYMGYTPVSFKSFMSLILHTPDIFPALLRGVGGPVSLASRLIANPPVPATVCIMLCGTPPVGYRRLQEELTVPAKPVPSGKSRRIRLNLCRCRYHPSRSGFSFSSHDLSRAIPTAQPGQLPYPGQFQVHQLFIRRYVPAGGT